VLNSGDDFYVTSAGLVVQETTIGNSNPDLATTFVSPLTLMEWLRNMLANRMAKSGWDWPGLYALHNSGSYCNQNMILDYNLFEPGKPLKNGTFIISEEIPGYVINNDLSQLVQEKGCECYHLALQSHAAQFPLHLLIYVLLIYVLTEQRVAFVYFRD